MNNVNLDLINIVFLCIGYICVCRNIRKRFLTSVPRSLITVLVFRIEDHGILLIMLLNIDDRDWTGKCATGWFSCLVDTSLTVQFFAITKTRLFKYKCILRSLPPKNENFQMKNSDSFIFLLKT